MEPFFGRIGSKTALVNDILKLIPKHDIYAEVFVGGGSIYFAKEPASKEYINDIDKLLINGYRLLKKIKKKEILKHAIHPSKDDNETINKIQDFVNKTYTDNEQNLLKILYISRNTFSFNWKDKIYKSGTHLAKLNQIDLYKKRMKNTIISRLDYKEFMNRIDNTNVFFYLDPPYENSEKLYKNVINIEDMSNYLKTIKGKFLLSLNDSPNIRELFKSFKMIKVTHKSISTGGTIGDKDRAELLIMNFDLK